MKKEWYEVVPRQVDGWRKYRHLLTDAQKAKWERAEARREAWEARWNARLAAANAEAEQKRTEPDWFEQHYGLVLLAVVVAAILFTVLTQPILGGFWQWQTGKP